MSLIITAYDKVLLPISFQSNYRMYTRKPKTLTINFGYPHLPYHTLIPFDILYLNWKESVGFKNPFTFTISSVFSPQCTPI